MVAAVGFELGLYRVSVSHLKIQENCRLLCCPPCFLHALQTLLLQAVLVAAGFLKCIWLLSSSRWEVSFYWRSCCRQLELRSSKFAFYGKTVALINTYRWTLTQQCLSNITLVVAAAFVSFDLGPLRKVKS